MPTENPDLETTISTEINQILSRVKIVLKDTSHPGNIGAVARAIKTMGLPSLSLVSPQTVINSEAYANAAGASSLLENISIFNSISEAISDCHFSFAFTARRREHSPCLLNMHEATSLIVNQSISGAHIALLFGGERSGLNNSDVAQADYAVEIPANPIYPSLNLGQAVQIASYSIRQQALLLSSDEASTNPNPIKFIEYPTIEHRVGLENHLIKIMGKIDLFKDIAIDDNHLTKKLKILINKASLTIDEVNLLRGFLKKLEKHIDK